MAGWFLMGSYYGLERGGYFRMAYVSFGRFFCQVFNNFGQEVYGPPGTLPPALFTNAPANPVVIPTTSNSDDVAAIDDSIVNLDEKMDFCHIFTKVVSFLDISSDGLQMPALFCDSALKAGTRSFRLVDESGVNGRSVCWLGSFSLFQGSWGWLTCHA